MLVWHFGNLACLLLPHCLWWENSSETPHLFCHNIRFINFNQRMHRSIYLIFTSVKQVSKWSWIHARDERTDKILICWFNFFKTHHCRRLKNAQGSEWQSNPTLVLYRVVLRQDLAHREGHANILIKFRWAQLNGRPNDQYNFFDPPRFSLDNTFKWLLWNQNRPSVFS
jgi:hypothetical protein